jgi:drug/metabolite transporter (DMT)-like permease
MAMYNAAYVRALGQVELLFTLAASVLFFGEKVTRREVGGMALVVGGLILMILFR